MSGCRTSGANVSDTVTADAQLESVLSDNLLGICFVAADTFKTKAEPACGEDIIEGICGQGENSLDAAVKSLANSTPMQNLIPAEKRAELPQQLRADFKLAIDKCLNPLVYKNIERQKQRDADPDRDKKARAAALKFAKNMLLQALYPALYLKMRYESIKMVAAAAKVAVPGQMLANPALATKTPFFIRQMTAALICKAGTAAAEFFIDENPPDTSSGSYCSKVGTFDANRMRSCYRAMGGVCMGMGGFINLRSIPGVDAQGSDAYAQISNSLNDIASLGLETACRIAGPASAAACGMINFATSQIITAWNTGTNDLGECTLNPLARCLGEMWAQGRWTNRNGIESPRRETDRDGKATWVNGCCLCERNFYKRVSWTTDPIVKTEWDLSVIQAGDFRSGNCAQKPGKYWDINASTYYMYTDCKRVDIVGGRCSLIHADENNDFHDITQWLWDAKSRQGTKRISRKYGIH